MLKYYDNNSMLAISFLRRVDQLQINDRIDVIPVNVTSDFMNITYNSDVRIRITSTNFSGSFKLQYLPGKLLSDIL